ncbi:MAG: haloacid dehalogenase type II [SAR324 cluster bacterium]|nr:haloacid dehalogenase type II [SAR324 cluster bacterium]
MKPEIKALTFDVFGTVVDWRSSIIEEGNQLNSEWGWELNWEDFADRWRGMYQPSMEEVRSGKREWVILDTLHRESLLTLLEEFGCKGVSEERVEHLNRMWHRLRPWSDSVEGLERLKKRFILATLSNGNVALLVNMAKFSSLPWDTVLGAEVSRSFKPMPHTYLTTASMLGLAPEECMMVAAHNSDLQVASGLGFRTAFVCRPEEYGPKQRTDLEAEDDYDLIANDFINLAEQLNC